MSVYLHVVLLDELVEVEGVGELQADVAAVEGGGSLPLHLLVPVLAELGHQLGQKRGTVSCRQPLWPRPPRAEEGGTQGTPVPEGPTPRVPSPTLPPAPEGSPPSFPPPAAPRNTSPGCRGGRQPPRGRSPSPG